MTNILKGPSPKLFWSRMSQVVTLVFSYFMLLGMFLQCVSGKDINNKPNIVILLADDVSGCRSLSRSCS